MHVGEHCINADAVTANVGFGPNLGVYRNQIGLSPNIKAESAEVEKCNSAVGDLAGKGRDRILHILLVEVLLEVDVEINSTKFICQCPSIPACGGQWRPC